MIFCETNLCSLNEGREIVGRSPLAADSGYGQDEVANLRGLLEAAALAEKEHPFRRDRRQQVHDQSRVRRTDAEIYECEIVFVRRRLHRASPAVQFASEHLNERVEIIGKIRQEDVLAEVIDGHAGVAGQPICRQLQLGRMPGILQVHDLIINLRYLHTIVNDLPPLGRPGFSDRVLALNSS